MNFTGKNLRLVRRGIAMALNDNHNEIATCPDVVAYAEELKALKVEREQFKRLRARIDAALVREELK